MTAGRDTTALSPGHTVRAPGADDAERVLALITASDIHEFGESQGLTITDLRNEWRMLDLGRDAWVVEGPDGALVGHAFVHDRGHVRLIVEGYVHPDHFGRGIGTTLVRLTEARAREHIELAPPGARVAIVNGINANNPDARALLEREGYAPDRYYLRMEAGLDQAPPEAAWPAGIAVRAMASDEDGRLFYQVKQEAMADHHGFVPETFEAWSAYVFNDDLDRDLWFIAMDGDEPAATAMCHEAGDMGWVGLLAVRRPWRRRGLGLALLHHAAGAFHRRGLRRYALAVDAQSPTGATRLYERAGMRATQTYAGYLKELRPGLEPGAPETSPPETEG